jgi:hypothetical protein
VSLWFRGNYEAARPVHFQLNLSFFVPYDVIERKAAQRGALHRYGRMAFYVIGRYDGF